MANSLVRFFAEDAQTMSRGDMERIQRTLGLLLMTKREGEDLELDAEELANTPVDSPSQSCG